MQQVKTEEVSVDECALAAKKQKNCAPEELMAAECWIWLSLTNDSGLILADGLQALEY